MTAAIWKFTLQMLETQLVQMPEGAEVLSVHVQLGEVQVWALVDTAASPTARRFEMYATGQPIPHGPDGTFVGTVMFQDGQYVFHVYEVVL